MSKTVTKQTKTTYRVTTPAGLLPALDPKIRAAIWEKARGMWKNRKPDPIKELAKMRKGWERKLPRLR